MVCGAYEDIIAVSDIVAEVALKRELVEEAKKAGAKGINVVGMCCSVNEILVRKGIPVAGNFLQRELAIVTGAVELMIVDIQCIMPSLSRVASCFHTKVVSTHYKGRFPGVEHVEFSEDRALDVAEKLIRMAIENYLKRGKSKINIPDENIDMVVGFTTEGIFHHLRGTYGATYRPLNNAIIE